MPNRHFRLVHSTSLRIFLAMLGWVTVAACGADDEHRPAPRNEVLAEPPRELGRLDLPELDDPTRRQPAADVEDLEEPASEVPDLAVVDPAMVGERRERLVIPVPASVTPLEFVWVPAGEFTCRDGDGQTIVSVDGFWISRTEVPWEVFDVLVHRLDLPEEDAGAEAETRPSKPYISMDRGFGHKGYPAISLSARSAEAFCAWLSEQSGRQLRLPTVDEWEYAALGGGTLRFPPAIEVLDEWAWHRGNADFKTHPVAEKAPNGYGVHDLLGNAAEWAVGPRGPVVCGGSYRDPRERLSASHRVEPDPDWNASDPQIPKSVWWLADGGFIGLRVVCEE